MIINAVRAAIGEPVIDVQQKPYIGEWAEIILHSDKPGVFDGLWISEKVRDNVVEEDLWISPGTMMGGFSAANEAIGTLIMNFETQERLEKVLMNQSRYIQVKIK